MPKTGTRLPWSDLMTHAFGTMKMKPADFWAMSPKEFLAALEAAGITRSNNPPDRKQLTDLMQLYPDALETIDEKRIEYSED